MSSRGRELATTGWALGSHRLSIRPAVRRELRACEAIAQGVRDPSLRETALHSLRSKAANPEATAILAIVAPRRRQRSVLRVSVAFQVLIDHLDTLGESPEGGSLEAGLRAHAALPLALTPTATTDPRAASDDGDDAYAGALVRRCQAAVAELPGTAALAAARAAAGRCGEGQSHTHAAALAGEDRDLREWATGLPPLPGYRWWERAAGASSSVAAHALIAAAGRSGRPAAEAAAIDAAYDPAVGALTVILDDLVDREGDAGSGEHSYLDHYADPAEMVDRLTEIAREARTGLAWLPQAPRHQAILAGVVAYYLSDPGAGRFLGDAARSRLLAAAGPTTAPLARALGLIR